MRGPSFFLLLTRASPSDFPPVPEQIDPVDREFRGARKQHQDIKSRGSVGGRWRKMLGDKGATDGGSDDCAGEDEKFVNATLSYSMNITSRVWSVRTMVETAQKKLPAARARDF